ncbi:hypothetical protein J25TS5_38240 [Paenibacillus faecis]|uniref:YhgE/Pip domain-containing protein n=1 Tax=Paenibacillus faecis TaxID=862114 RepID=UPI001B1F1159|nr:ABC transporter permease [Paenibacillus faecis]GIO86892.1 hypothetical protein J25TS5_38240 [Paenibacillus faecis]
MKKSLQAYLKAPQTKVGIITALMFQVIFSLIWMTAYDGVNERVSSFQIAVVNEDGAFGEKLVGGLRQSVPFAWETGLTADEAKQALEDREVQMIMTIPEKFGQTLQTPGQAGTLQYTINGSNASMVKSVMESAAARITESLNRLVSTQAIQTAFQEMALPEAQAGQLAQGLSGKVASQVDVVHPIDGMNNQMVPMMLVLASFVGSMIMGMNLQQAAAGMNPGISGGSRFAARVVLNVGASLLVSLVGTSLVFALGGQAEQGFFIFWMFQSLLVLTFLFFTQMFLLLFGMAGMLFNIAGLSLQLVSSGAMVPRQLLSHFYQAVGDYLPATYAVEGLMNVQFTGAGGAVASDMLRLAVIMGVSLAIGLTAELVKGRKRGPAKESQVLVKPGTVVQD